MASFANHFCLRESRLPPSLLTRGTFSKNSTRNSIYRASRRRILERELFVVGALTTGVRRRTGNESRRTGREIVKFLWFLSGAIRRTAGEESRRKPARVGGKIPENPGTRVLITSDPKTPGGSPLNDWRRRKRLPREKQKALAATPPRGLGTRA